MSTQRPILLIKPSLKHAGFAASLLTVLNYARYCERENLTPVVHIDASCDSRFLDPEYGDNVWEQYFEPVGPYSSADVQRMLDDATTGQRAPKFCYVDAALALRIKTDPDSIFTWTYGPWRTRLLNDPEGWFMEQRRKGRETICKYVRVKPHILEKVDRFFDRHMKERPVLGVHMRGTDLRYAPPVSPAEYFEPIEHYLANHPGTRIFLATDQVQYLELMRKRYGNILHHYDCLRSSTSTAPFNGKQGSPYRRGEDVLIDILLLSKCAFLIRGASNIPEMAMYFSKNLESTDLSLGKRFAFGQDYLGRWSDLATRPAWEVIKNTDMEHVSRHAASQNMLQKVGYESRRVWAAVIRNRRAFRRNLRRFFGNQKS